MEIGTTGIECFQCHVIFWITKAHNGRLEKTGESFYCPNGHSQHFTDSTESKLEEEKARADRLRNMLSASVEDKINLKREINAYKGHITRLKNKQAAK